MKLDPELPLTELTPDLSRLLERVVEEAGFSDRNLFNSLSEHEKNVLLEIIRQMGTDGRSPILDVLWEAHYETKPVSLDTFVDDPYYLGGVGQRLYPKWREELNDLFDPKNDYLEWVISGGIGLGKTSVSIIALLYKVYNLLCLRNPQVYYGLIEGDTIAFGFFNILLDLAESVTFRKLLNYMRTSPYFLEAAGIRPDKLNPKDAEIIKLPKRVTFAYGSSAVHALGMNMLGGVLSEVAFSKSPEQRQITELYDAVKRRIESRFLRPGLGTPGLLIIDSSKKHEGDWLEQHLAESERVQKELGRSKPFVKVSSFAIWEVNPKWAGRTYETFPVVVGDKYRKSVVLKSGDPRPEDRPVVEVPVEFLEAFLRDPDGALRDIAGIATYAYSPLILDRSKVKDCLDEKRSHPFELPEPVLSLDSDFSLMEIFRVGELFQLVDPYQRLYRLKVDPGVKRYVHIDLGLTSDAAGLAMLHVQGFRHITRLKTDGLPIKARLPVIYVDFMLRIRPPIGSQIDIGKIVEFILQLMQLGVQLGAVTADQWQSKHLLQIFAKQNIPVKEVSVDRKADAYIALRDCIQEGRISYYEYEPFIDEILKVQLDREKYKVDHPVGGSKDVSDAVAGALFRCIMDLTSEQTELPPLAGLAQQRLVRPSREEIVRQTDFVIRDYPEAEYMDLGDL